MENDDGIDAYEEKINYWMVVLSVLMLWGKKMW